MNKSTVAVALGVLLLAGAGLGARSQTAKAVAAPTSIRTVATTKQLMHIGIIPSSDVIFKAAGDPPKADDAWSEIHDCALALAEAGNLLMIGSRVVDRTTWLKFSRAMVDAAADAAKAAETKDPKALAAASDQIYETCETCHTKYVKK